MTQLLCETCLIGFLNKMRLIKAVVFKANRGKYHCSMCGEMKETPRESIFVVTEMKQ